MTNVRYLDLQLGNLAEEQMIEILKTLEAIDSWKSVTQLRLATSGRGRHLGTVMLKKQVPSLEALQLDVDPRNKLLGLVSRHHTGPKRSWVEALVKTTRLELQRLSDSLG
ncbi:hypothetical protein F5X97DRAFT_340172 [Nemania serpens]|nr:hypothetical protein F5X97DRAFT_340172 [Nemania serpens]